MIWDLFAYLGGVLTALLVGFVLLVALGRLARARGWRV